MNLPPAGGTLDTPEMWEKAQAESERLHEELKKQVRVEGRDIGVLRKELHITVPAKVIAAHLEHNYAELMHDAFVPGFRKGHAPRRLVEKRYGAEVRESLTTAVVGQSFYAATENEKLEVLGDPLFRMQSEEGTRLVDFDQALQSLKLPETGDFSYTCEVELKPSFELPELKGIEIQAPEVEITDAMVDEQLLRRRKLRGRFEPVPGPAERDDQVIADVTLTVAGQAIKREENVKLAVRPGAVDGVPLIDLGDRLAGVEPGQTRTVSGRIPPDYERADLRGQPVEFAFAVHELKRLVPEELADFFSAWGFADEAEAREHFREELESDRDRLLARARRSQIEDYLLAHTLLELPQDFSTRQTERAVLRRVVELQRQGLPLSDIEGRIDELRTSARADVARELKLGFVLEKAATQLGVQVTDEEVNTEIARIARLYNRRFDRVRDDLQARGLLDQLVEEIRQSKTIDLLLADARVTSAPPPAAAPAKGRRKRG